FFFQAEDGIRDRNVTGVQTCALPILEPSGSTPMIRTFGFFSVSGVGSYLKEKNPKVRIIGVDPLGSILKDYFYKKEAIKPHTYKIGRASCRERVAINVRTIVVNGLQW